MILKTALPFLLLVLSFAIASGPTTEYQPKATASTQVQTAIDLRWYSMREAQLKAATTGQKVLVHIYAEWCAWCTKMDDKTYSVNRVHEEISKYYYPVRIDGESKESIVFNGQKMTMEEFTKSLGVTAYPTTLFIDKEGEIIAQQGGYIKADVFTKLLSYVGSDAYQLQEFDQFTSNHTPH